MVRDREVPMWRAEIDHARRVMIIGTCLGIPCAELLASPANTREIAVVASGHCESAAAGGRRVSRFAGVVERNALPDGWADCIVGHCVLDEFETTLTAFSELARTRRGRRDAVDVRTGVGPPHRAQIGASCRRRDDLLALAELA
jgi:hypothetical protein